MHGTNLACRDMEIDSALRTISDARCAIPSLPLVCTGTGVGLHAVRIISVQERYKKHYPSTSLASN